MISVIVPVYNMEKYLDKCICSIVDQTYAEIEIMLVDDGSTDASFRICNEWAEKDSRIIVLHKENGGQGSARNMALDAAKGDYIGFVDSDDWIERDMYEKLLDDLLEWNADISCCKTSGNKLTNQSVVYKQPEIMRAHLSNILDQSPCNKLYKRELFSNVRFSESRAYEDCATIYRLLACSNIVVDRDTAYYHYETRENSTMTAGFSEKKLFIIDAYKGMYNFYEENYPQYALEARRLLVGAVQYCMGEMLNIKDHELYKNYGKSVQEAARNIEKKGLPLKSKVFLSMIAGCPLLYGLFYKIFK